MMNLTLTPRVNGVRDLPDDLHKRLAVALDATVLRLSAVPAILAIVREAESRGYDDGRAFIGDAPSWLTKSLARRLLLELDVMAYDSSLEPYDWTE